MSLCIYVVKRKSKWFILLLLHLLRNSLSVSLSELNQTEMLVQWSILYTPYVVERCTKYLIKIMYPHYKILGLGFFIALIPKIPIVHFHSQWNWVSKSLWGHQTMGDFFLSAIFSIIFIIFFYLSWKKEGRKTFYGYWLKLFICLLP